MYAKTWLHVSTRSTNLRTARRSRALTNCHRCFGRAAPPTRAQQRLARPALARRRYQARCRTPGAIGAPSCRRNALLCNHANHVADPVGGLIGGNLGTGGTIPEGTSMTGQAIRAVTLQPDTVHKCYGKSANDGCANLWRDTSNFPQLTPAITPLGIKK